MWWQFITSGWLIEGWRHLAQNAFFICVFGKAVERLQGGAAMVSCFLVSGIGGWRLLPAVLDLPHCAASATLRWICHIALGLPHCAGSAGAAGAAAGRCKQHLAHSPSCGIFKLEHRRRSSTGGQHRRRSSTGGQHGPAHSCKQELVWQGLRSTLALPALQHVHAHAYLVTACITSLVLPLSPPLTSLSPRTPCCSLPRSWLASVVRTAAQEGRHHVWRARGRRVWPGVHGHPV
jgi:hypothetical protein